MLGSQNRERVEQTSEKLANSGKEETTSDLDGANKTRS